MNRRRLLTTAACLPLLALTACPGGSGSGLTLAQVVADVTGMVNGLSAALPALTKLVPATTMARIQADINVAQNLLAQITPKLPDATNAVTIQQIEAVINEILGFVANIPGVPPEIAAVAILLPIIEAFVNGLVPSMTASMVMKAPMPAATDAAKARALLKVKPAG